ncbi:uncharacterized protein LOC142011559 [Carettochelys insculpta]|uniref:uncharacterized protein LOC142011559 n=1 Tax=Carettochelys insculpta TaxID=44489 RepID=UPI003EB9AC65
MGFITELGVRPSTYPPRPPLPTAVIATGVRVTGGAGSDSCMLQVRGSLLEAEASSVILPTHIACRQKRGYPGPLTGQDFPGPWMMQPWKWEKRGTGFASLEGLDSTGAVSVVPDSPPGPSHRGSPAAEQGPAPGQARHCRSHPRASADPQLLANLWCQVEVSEHRLHVGERRLHLQERALAWHQEAWGSFMRTFERIAERMAPPAVPAAIPPSRPPPVLEPAVQGDSGPQEPAQPYLPVLPAPTQPRQGLQPRCGSCPPTPGAGQ